MEAKVYATFRPLVGDSTVVLESGPATVGAAIEELSERFPQLGDRLLDEAGEPRHFVAIMVDGRDIRHTGGLATPLHDDAHPDIFPPGAGGSHRPPVAGGR